MNLSEVDPQQRERLAVRYICENPFLLKDILVPLGLSPAFSWVMLEMPHSKLVADRVGDVDLLAGNLTLMPSGEIEWPPNMKELVAVEAKCAIRERAGSSVKSQKGSAGNSRAIRIQLDELWRFVPVNRVALLDIVVNPPATGEDGQAWLSAAGMAASSLDVMRPTLTARLPEDSGFGHLAFSWGAVAGADERWRGAGAPAMWRAARENPCLAEPAVQERRSELESNLRRLLARHPPPIRGPAVLDLQTVLTSG